MIITLVLAFIVPHFVPFTPEIRLFLFFLIILNVLVLKPITLPTKEVEVAGNYAYRAFEARSEIGLIIADSNKQYNKYSRQERFEITSWSLSWLNMLEQELGRVDLIRFDDISNEIISKKRFLVLTSSCTASSKIDDEKLRIFEEWVYGGGTLILEKPPNKLRSLSGISIKGSQIPKRVNWCNNELLDETLREDLMEMPLYTSLQKVVKKDEDVLVELRMDEYIAICSRRLGNGFVATLLFDLGIQLTSLRQGAPDDGFKVLDKRGILGIIDVCDLLVSSKMLNNPVPYTDLLQGLIIQVIERRVILPRIWRFHPSYDGVAIMTHDEESFGDPCLELAKWEASNGYTSTFFIMPDSKIKSEIIHEMKQSGFDVQIHWDREPKRRFLIFKYIPSLRKQVLALSKKMAGAQIGACRIHRLKWDSDYTRSFRVLAGSDLHIDTSMGMCGYTGKGYIFGTGLPYRPLDSNGEPLPLWELPFQVQDHYKGAGSEYQNKLLVDSRCTYHESICVLFHVNRCFEEPTRTQWMKFFEMATKHNHMITNISHFIARWEKRLTINLQSKVNGDIIKVDYKLENPQDVGEYGLFIPATYGNASKIQMLQKEPAMMRRSIVLYGKKYFLIPLTQESGTLSITYLKQE